jgi:hypothetical protein
VTKGVYDVAPGINPGRRSERPQTASSYQSVIVWQRDERIEVALVADFIREIQTKEAHEAVVRDAVNAWVAPGAPSVVPAERRAGVEPGRAGSELMRFAMRSTRPARRAMARRRSLPDRLRRC